MPKPPKKSERLLPTYRLSGWDLSDEQVRHGLQIPTSEAGRPGNKPNFTGRIPADRFGAPQN
jgi:hypothetical protein